MGKVYGDYGTVVNCLTPRTQVRRSAGAGGSRGMALYEDEVTASDILRITHEKKILTILVQEKWTYAHQG